MATLDKVSLRVSPITKQVVLVRMGKDPTLALEVKKVTNQFLVTLFDYVQSFATKDDQEEITIMCESPARKFELTLKVLPNE